MCKTGAGVAPIYKQGPRDRFLNYVGPTLDDLSHGTAKLLRPGSCPDLLAAIQVRLQAPPGRCAPLCVLASIAPMDGPVLLLPNVEPSLHARPHLTMPTVRPPARRAWCTRML